MPDKPLRGWEPLGFDFTFAFQPIVDLGSRSVFGYEALVRGREGQPAASVLAKVDAENREQFDQATRLKTISLAHRLFGNTDARLTINVSPNAVVEPARSVHTTVEICTALGFPLDRLIFEMTEHETIENVAHLRSAVDHYRVHGLATAIDDFGSGISGLTILADFVPDYLKIDRALVRGVDGCGSRQAIIDGILLIADRLGVKVVAEGIEREEELAYLAGCGIDLFQGYYIARPTFEAVPEIDFSRFPTVGGTRETAAPLLAAALA
ncbi:EAL domain-containing protein [Acuticoccus kandeliae]|uniref:EAL domain-containing protein n=1 Tax=Acuticoccus kandeliae TaxID=2073160 RepID=UPI000D3E2F7E|nr:EAL domain-containing protein [Acuticoccus kandeliae]